MTNAEFAQAAFRALESGNALNIAPYLADDFVWHGNLPQDLSKEKFLNLAVALKRAFPDFTFGLKIVGEPSQNIVRATMEPVGTHTGELILPGLVPVAPTGIVVALPRQVLIFTLQDEKITRLELEVASGGGLEDLLAHLGVEVSDEWFAGLFKGGK